jgi:hypothetical protein
MNCMQMKLFLVLVLGLIILPADAASQDFPPQLTTEQVKIIGSATPRLPQTPVVKRSTSDAQDENLKGQVNRVLIEEEDLSSTRETQGRHFESIDYYDANGMLITTISFSSDGTPYDVTGYGFIKGMRVSRLQHVAGAEVNTGAMSAEEQERLKATRPADPHFDYEYRFKYDHGQLVEKDCYMNDGSLYQRSAYKRVGNEFEEIDYTNDGKPNQKYVSRLGDDGNQLELLDVAVINQRWRGDQKYKFRYESFDKSGNWTKRVKLQVFTENGKEVLKPSYATYRTITYHGK